MQTVIDEWNKGKLQIVNRMPNRQFPGKPKYGVIRRWAEWTGIVTNGFRPISPDLHQIEYLPLKIEKKTASKLWPEEMRWWLDGLRARHIEFEEQALPEILEKLGSLKDVYTNRKGVELLIQGKRKEWDNRVQGRENNPMSIFRPIYFWNTPAMVKKRREARMQRES